MDQTEDSAENDTETETPGNPNEFDRSLPVEHSYLGNMNYLHGYTLLDDYMVTEMLGICTDTLVCPGHTLPLVIDYRHQVDLIRQHMERNKMLALLCASGPEKFFEYGVTLEIFEAKEDQTGMCLKAKGRQRCKILKESIIRNVRMGKVIVQILPEIVLPSPLSRSDLQVLNKRRHAVEDYDSFMRNDKFRRYDAAVTRWPKWVYDQYEPYCLAQHIITFLEKYSLGECLPTDPVKLSYWFMQNFQLSHIERLQILRVDTTVQRLRLELQYLKAKRMYCCAACLKVIAEERNVFPMSKDGIQSNYCNPGGHVFETLTVSEAKGLRLIGTPSEEFSWFPGYAWTIAQCAQCNHHLGWRFTSPKLNPKKFWGLVKNNIATKII